MIISGYTVVCSWLYWLVSLLIFGYMLLVFRQLVVLVTFWYCGKNSDSRDSTSKSILSSSINLTESFQIAQVLLCSVNFCSCRLAVLRLHGLRLCTQAVHSHLQAPRSGRGALRRGPERGLLGKFWRISDRIWPKIKNLAIF